MSEGRLFGRRAGRHLDDDTLARPEALGVVERVADGTVRVQIPALLGVSAELAALPLLLDTLIASHEAVERHTTALPAELQQVFQDTVVRPYREGGRAPEERARLMELAGELNMSASSPRRSSRARSSQSVGSGAVDTVAKVETPGR